MHMVEQAARLYLTRWEMENGDADSTTITASELVQQGYLSPLAEGEDYNITITRTENSYDVTVTASTVKNLIFCCSHHITIISRNMAYRAAQSSLSV